MQFKWLNKQAFDLPLKSPLNSCVPSIKCLIHVYQRAGGELRPLQATRPPSAMGKHRSQRAASRADPGLPSPSTRPFLSEGQRECPHRCRNGVTVTTTWGLSGLFPRAKYWLKYFTWTGHLVLRLIRTIINPTLLLRKQAEWESVTHRALRGRWWSWGGNQAVRRKSPHSWTTPTNTQRCHDTSVDLRVSLPKAWERKLLS